jgi:hypothetical protein
MLKIVVQFTPGFPAQSFRPLDKAGEETSEHWYNGHRIVQTASVVEVFDEYNSGYSCLIFPPDGQPIEARDSLMRPEDIIAYVFGTTSLRDVLISPEDINLWIDLGMPTPSELDSVSLGEKEFIRLREIIAEFNIDLSNRLLALSKIKLRGLQ